jgi:hypothetical protein
VTTLLRAVLLATLLAASAPVRADEDAGRYLVSEVELSQLPGRLTLGTQVQAAPAASEAFDAHADFLVDGDELALSASILPSLAEARAFFGEIARIMESDNERTRIDGDPRLASEYGLDELRAYRLIHLHPVSQARVSNYARLFRLGRAVGLIEAVGDPGADDAGVVDNDRALKLLWTSQLMFGKMAWSPPDPISRPIPGLGDFVAGWTRHGFGLGVDGDGRGEASWRVYSWCRVDPTPPCDGEIGNQIVDGGRAKLVFFRVDGQSAFGTVVSSSDPGLLGLGEVTLSLQPYGMARLEQLQRSPVELCGPDYLRLAPKPVREAMPCGA